MTENLCGFIALFATSLGTALVVYAMLRKSLHALLDEVVRLPSGTTFYQRLFAISLVFIALSAALKTEFDLEEGSAFMEYVWKVACGLSSVFAHTCLFCLGYLVLITVLVAVLRSRND